MISELQGGLCIPIPIEAKIASLEGHPTPAHEGVARTAKFALTVKGRLHEGSGA